jgi:N-methylhydantoinase B/oxoprolinase/acetone carboxylase alpha subunit
MGIGEGGKTLRQMLGNSRRLYEETGCYTGLKKLRNKQADPLRYELFHSRILSSLISGRETTRMISASPLVRELAELCIGLYTPEGHNIAQSTGIQVHTTTMGDAIQWMIDNNYEEEVGINDGDLFCCNDNAIAGMHPADVYDILPIFCERELVGWVSTVIMEADIGAINPPCMPVAGNAERATDGVRICAEKIGWGDKMRRDFEVRIERTIGMYQMFLLNRRGAIAANVRVREEVKDLIKEFGLDYYRQTTRELIEDERRTQLARIKQRTIPGRYRNVGSLELYMKDQPVCWLPGKVDVIRLTPVEMVIEPSGKISLDFEGTGEWGWHSMNATPSGLYGGLSIALVQSLCYDGRANLGSLLPCQVKAPIDSLLNPSRVLELPTANIWTPSIYVFDLWLALMGTAFYLRGFREETFGFVPGHGFQPSGYNQYGHKGAFLSAAIAGYYGGCARGVADGVDMGAQFYTAEPDIGNFEIWEMFYPYLDLARKVDPYSVGHGRFRGGASMHAVWTPHRTPFLMVSSSMGGGAVRTLLNTGLFGGYPAGRSAAMILTQTNMKQLVENRQPLVFELGHPADPEFLKWNTGQLVYFDKIVVPTEIHEGDIVVTMPSSGSGLGDPVERRPEQVIADLEKGLTTPEIAKEIYCVDASYDQVSKKWKVDEAKTKRLRHERRKQRVARGVPVKEWWRSARQRLLSADVAPLLREMYQSSMTLSQPFAREFRDFWCLPNDFNL